MLFFAPHKLCLIAAFTVAFTAFDTTAETSGVPETTTLSETNTDAALRAYLQLQEQLHAAQLAIERARQESDAAATRNAEAIAARLQAFQDSLASQREKELEELRGANRLMLIIGGTCASVGFIAMLLTAYYHWRAITRLTEFSMVSQASLTIGRTAALPPPSGETPSASLAVEQAASQMFGTLQKLEQRIRELEHTSPAETDGNAAKPAASAANGEQAERLGVLIARGQSFLNQDKTEEALGVFDEILAIDPHHTDTLVKKGEALERLRRVDEAILCYDQAIAADRSMTIAYLHKGGLFNRMERYEEALQCYEQALKTQEKSAA